MFLQLGERNHALFRFCQNIEHLAATKRSQMVLKGEITSPGGESPLDN
ncbi:hypothetical protein CKA32_000846 [Geitlerinema sp. FC II]|nr:hypothetical protein CKA32_000846 [Geitlerinema sp. FC II]